MSFDFGLHIHFLIPSSADGYNCSGLSVEFLIPQPSSGLGNLFIFLGVAATLIYAVLIIAMSDREIFSNSCLKLIYFNCWIDIGSIATGGFITGVLFLRGDSFCTNQFWTFATGAIGLGCWSASCVICIALAINRLCILYKAEFGHTCWLILAIALIYGTFMATCTRPVIFNAKQGSWFFVPNIRPGSGEEKFFVNSYHLLENCITALITPIIYIFVCIKLRLSKCSAEDESTFHRKRQLSVFLQCALICSLVCVASALYVYMQIFDYPPWLPTTAEIAYQICGTLPAAVLLVLNGKIRSRALELIPFYGRHQRVYTVPTRNKTAVSTRVSSSPSATMAPRLPKRSHRRVIDVWKAAPISVQSVTSLG